MELSWPVALLALAAVVPAWWLARRSRGRASAHPLWFLVEPGVTQARRRKGVRARLLLVAAVALAALAASGPTWRTQHGARVLVVDESATRVLDVDQVRARLRGFDEAVLVAPGRPPRRMPASAAAAALAPASGTITAAELADGVTAAQPRAHTVEIAGAPPPGDDVAIARVAFHRDPLAPRRGRFAVELALHGGAPAPTAIVARAGDVERGRATPVATGTGAYAIVPYEGDGGEVITLALEPVAADDLALDDTATVTVPALGAAPVWIDPALAAAPIARALAVLPTVTRVPEPGPDAIAVVPSTAWAGPARARIVVTSPPPASPNEPLLAVAGSSLPGVTPALLASAPDVAVATDAAGAAAADRVWLRAGPHAAMWLDDGAPPTLHLAAAIDGPVLPIALAEALAAAPLTEAAVIARADVRPPPPAPALPHGTSGDRRRGWPARVLVIAAALLLLAETIVTRPRRAGLALRVASVAGFALLATLGVEPPHRRVVFVLDLSASVAPAATEARAEVGRLAAALAPHDRASLIVVAGGARVVVDPGAPDEVVAYARRGALDPAALGLDPGRTDLGAGLALAARTLGGPGGEIVLVGDGRDSVRGDAAVRASADLIGRGFTFVPIDTGEEVRIVASSAMVHAAPGRTFAVPFELEARVARDVEVAVTHHGRELARRTVRAAAGRTRSVVDVILDEAGSTELELAIAPGSRRARVHVHVAAAGRTLRLDAGSVATLTDVGLAGVDAVILDGIPGGALDPPAREAVARFVSSGGTLLWAAAPEVTARDAAALGALLPLRPGAGAPAAILLLVDRSGSIDAAGRRAALPGAAELAAAAQALGPDDRFGAIAFDAAATDWIPLAPAGTARQVPALPPPRGGTDPAPALALARQRLATAPPAARRIAVLVSDGGFAAAAERSVEQARALAADGIRVEVIAVGAIDEAARARLAAVAAAGGGRVHEPAAGVAAALPALRAVPAPAGRAATARARATWSAELGDAPALLVAGAPVAGHVVLEPARDAVVLADVGDAPLLAVRRHGAGRAFAWAADLDGAWIDPAIATSVLAAIAAVSRDDLSLVLAPRPSDHRTLDLRATTATDRTAPLSGRVVRRDGAITTMVLVPAAPGTLVAELAAPAEAAVIEVERARLPVSPFDLEHEHLGAALDPSAVERAAPSTDHQRVWSLLPLIALALIGVLALALWLPDR